MSQNIVYFDLETKHAADDVGGWSHIDKMGMSIGVTYSTARGDYKIYGEPEVEDLIKELQRADLVVGFNHIRFDYRVLEGYSIFDFSQVPSLDMLIVLNDTLGHRLKLDSIAQATLGCEKSAEGLQATRVVQARQARRDRRVLLLRCEDHQARPRIRRGPRAFVLHQSVWK